MKIVELIKISTETLKMMSNSGIKTGDWQHVKMYEEYQEMRNNAWNFALKHFNRELYYQELIGFYKKTFQF